MSISVVRRVDYRAMPWRNGAGTTLEIERAPAASEAFDWRLSLASIGRSGPFSSYPGYQRSVTLIAGEGFRLDISGQEPAVLDRAGETCVFAGAAQTSCTLRGGECHDLSLMVRAPGEILSVTTVALDTQPRELTMNGAGMNALFCIGDAPVLVAASGGAGHAASPSGALQLLPLDTLLIGPDTGTVELKTSSVTALVQWLYWRPAQLALG